MSEYGKHKVIWLFTSITLIVGAYLYGKHQPTEQNINNNNITNDNSTPSKITKKKESWTDHLIQNNPPLIKEKKRVKTQIESLFDIKKIEQKIKEELKPDTDLLDKYKEVIDFANSEEISHHLNQLLPEEALYNISDQKALSKRLLEEYTDQDNTDTLSVYGDISFSLDSTFPNEQRLNFNVKKQQSIFSHIQLNGPVNDNGQIFIKWINLNNNKVILFERKIINGNLYRNWISAIPANGWMEGSYLVTMYMLESELRVIAQNSYYVDYVE